MSPLALRRYRAERVLREEYERLRSRVLATAGAKLRARGATVDAGDLEDCYAQAWHGLYGALLAGEPIANPAGWLAVVTFRRAIEEQRARRRARGGHDGADEGEAGLQAVGAPGRDLADELDDRLALRALMEGMRARLDERERQAAALCYLQGLSRRAAAGEMGISEARMRKLMDGPRPGRPGVAAKVGALARGISEGSWCAEQASLMRALAFGVLDPAGERYRLACHHRRECPACRAYVASLRRVAVLLPPVLAPLRFGVPGLGGAGAGAHALAASAGSSGTVPAGSSVAGTGAAGAAGAGGAGSSLLLAGPLGAKLALGCLLAIGVGAGCAVELGAGAGGRRRERPVHATRASEAPPDAPAAGAQAIAAPAAHGARGGAVVSQRKRVGAPPGRAPAAAGASREFGPERRAPSPPGVAPARRSATPVDALAAAAGSVAQTAAAEREFAP